MSAFPLSFADGFADGALGCPICGDGYTHLDEVRVAARREDGPARDISVHAISGHIGVDQGFSTDVPAGSIVGVGRRHRIAVLGTCEQGCEFALVLTQCKGQTYVEVMTPEWRPITPKPPLYDDFGDEPF